MHSVKGEDIILNADALAIRAAMFVEAFEEDLALSLPLNVSLSFHRDPATRLPKAPIKFPRRFFPNRITTG